MKALIVCAAAAVAGCAMSPERAWQLAKGSPEWELCYVAISGRGDGNLRQAVYQELQDRRVDCNRHAALVSARMQQDSARSAASTSLGLQLLRAGQPRANSMPQPTYCRSVVNGNVVNTVCD